MILGLIGTAAYFAGRDRRAPLWWYMLATFLPDIGYAALLAADVEHLGRVSPTRHGAYGLRFSFGWSHSLVMIAVCAGILGCVTWKRWGVRSAILVAYATIIHWPLDALVHRPELALLPGNAFDLPRFGLGLWQIGWLSTAIELGLFLIGTLTWWHAHNETRSAHRWAAPIASVILAAAILNGIGWIAAQIQL